jgi:hypothetical protein
MARNKCSTYGSQRVVVWDKEQNRQIVVLTNHLDLGPITISARSLVKPKNGPGLMGLALTILQ